MIDGQQDDLVAITVKVYDVQFDKAPITVPLDSDRSVKPIAILVGDRGLYHPRHLEHMHWLPLDLLVFPVETKAIPIGTVHTITLPRWLAAKKGLKYE